jgi:hypothetical protein
VVGGVDSGLFDFWLRFGSITGCIKPAPSPKPRQKSKILAAHRHIISVNALVRGSRPGSAIFSAGNNIASNIAMIAITTSNSIKVKALFASLELNTGENLLDLLPDTMSFLMGKSWLSLA